MNYTSLQLPSSGFTLMPFDMAQRYIHTYMQFDEVDHTLQALQPCHTKKHICSNPSEQHPETLNLNDLMWCMHGILWYFIGYPEVSIILHRRVSKG